MAAVSPSNAAAFELKSAALTLVAWVPRTTDLGLLAEALARQAIESPGLFDREPVVIDLSQVRDDETELDLRALVALLRRHRMLPIASKGGNRHQRVAAVAAGLVEVPERHPPRAVAAPAPAPAPTPVEAPLPTRRTTMIIDRPLRSGQQVYARGSDLVVTAPVSYGAEIVADGTIHVYAPLRGRALAGALGDSGARIFATCMEPQLLSIAGTWRTTEVELPPDVLGKPAQVRLEGPRLVVEPLGA